jgi:phage shock protein PspC (stress-responsive transcriptional regulator)
MKKTVSINLNGQVFVIDEDAFDELQSYLDAIASQFANSEESKEIIADIEARIAELFTEYISASKQSITISDVLKVVEIMGKPNDFSDDSQEQKNTTDQNQTYSSTDSRSKKRLFRDPDNRVIGGVAAGIAAWADIDPVIVRVLFVVSFFIFGPLLYFILWIIIPLARTPSQRLEMRGEDVNLQNIERIIKEEFQQVKDSLNNLKKKENRKRIKHEFSESFSGIARIFIGLGKIITGFLIAAFMFVFMIFIGVMTHIIPFNFIAMHCNSAAPFSSIFQVFMSQSSSVLLFWGILLFVGTILLSIIVNLVKVITGNYKRWWFLNSIFTFITLLGLALIIISVVREAKHFNVSTQTITRNNIDLQKNDTLNIEISDSSFKNIANEESIWNYNDNGDFSFKISSTKCHFIKGDLTIYSNPKIYFEQSKTDSAYLMITRTANGESHDEAVVNCNTINYPLNIKEATIYVSPYFTVIKSQWRLQNVVVVVFLPNGTSIKLGKDLSKLTKDLNEDQVYTMKNGKLE